MEFSSFGKLAAVAAAVYIGLAFSLKVARRTITQNRSEWPSYGQSGLIERSVLHWILAQARDDIGGIFAMLAIANGLLAGILTLLALDLFR